MDRLFKALPFLTAFFIAVAAMPTNVVQVNAKQMGTEHAQPYRAKALSGLERAVGAAYSRIFAIVESLAGHPLRGPALAGAAVLVAAFIAPEQVGQFGMVAMLGSLQLARQNEIDARTKRDKLVADKSAIADTVLARAEGQRKMTAEEQTKFLQLGKDITEAEANLAEATSMREAAEAKAAIERNPTQTPAVDDPDARAAGKAAGVVLGKNNADNDPTRGFKSHREFMATVLTAGQSGRVDARLKPLQVAAAAGSDEHGTHSDPSAAFLLPVAYSPDILKVQSEGDPTAALTRKLPMDAPMVKINARTDKDHTSSVSGGLRVYRHSETAAATSSKAATEQLTFAAEDLMGLAYATENQISDSPGAFIALISDGFRDEFDRKLLQEKMRGVGSAGQYTGVMNSPALITVAKETGQAADTIVKENIDKMESRLWGPDASDRVAYLANKTTLPQLSSLVQNVGTGGVPVPYLTRDTGGWRLNGRRLFFSETCKAIGDLGDIVLVNWAEYIEGLYQPMQQAESIHVRFDRNERAFKFWVRNCGKCWWSAALTPENGATMSPLVTLAAR